MYSSSGGGIVAGPPLFVSGRAYKALWSMKINRLCMIAPKGLVGVVEY